MLLPREEAALEAAPVVRREDIESVAASVFSTMMNLDVTPSDAPFPGCSGLLTSAVHLTGEQERAVCFHCAPGEACGFAGRFVGMPAPDVVDDDVRDVMGEVANMIAGNLKCVLAPGIRISIPSVTEGPAYSIRFRGARAVYQTAFRTECGHFWITFFERLAQQTG